MTVKKKEIENCRAPTGTDSVMQLMNNPKGRFWWWNAIFFSERPSALNMELCQMKGAPPQDIWWTVTVKKHEGQCVPVKFSWKLGKPCSKTSLRNGLFFFFFCILNIQTSFYTLTIMWIVYSSVQHCRQIFFQILDVSIQSLEPHDWKRAKDTISSCTKSRSW